MRPLELAENDGASRLWQLEVAGVVVEVGLLLLGDQARPFVPAVVWLVPK